MARPLRIEFSGALYHATSRGNRQEDIYIHDADRAMFLNVLEGVCTRFNWLLHAYCLMSNHYHLLVETPDGNLSKGMRQLNGVYTQRFNQTHGRVGHVFQGRYKAILVQKDSYLLELARYIVLNPVRAGMVRDVADWPWSSYRAMAGYINGPEWLQTDWVLATFSDSKKEAIVHYRTFVSQGNSQPKPWEQLKNQIYLGSAEFVDEMLCKLSPDVKLSEIPSAQKRQVTKPLRFFQKKYSERDLAILKAYQSGGYSMKEIGDYFGLYYSRVSRIIKNGIEAKSKT